MQFFFFMVEGLGLDFLGFSFSMDLFLGFRAQTCVARAATCFLMCCSHSSASRAYRFCPSLCIHRSSTCQSGLTQ